MFTDESGTILLTLVVGALIGAGLSAISSIVSQLATTHEVEWGQVGISAAFGAVGGALSVTGIGGVVGQFAIQGALSVGELYSLGAVSGDVSSIGVGEVLGTFALSGVLGAIGAKGAAKEFKRVGQIEASFIKYAKRDITRYGDPIIQTIAERGNKYIKKFIFPTVREEAIANMVSLIPDIASFYFVK